jgi:hypothetical protein
LYHKKDLAVFFFMLLELRALHFLGRYSSATPPVLSWL